MSNAETKVADTVIEKDDPLTVMWKGSNSELELSDSVDPSRTDLLDDFDRDPLGRHDIELQLMVSAIRGSSRIPRFVLGQVEFGRWIVLQVAETRGGEPTRISDDVFDDLRAAERFVFALRLQLLAAEDAK